MFLVKKKTCGTLWKSTGDVIKFRLDRNFAEEIKCFGVFLYSIKSIMTFGSD